MKFCRSYHVFLLLIFVANLLLCQNSSTDSLLVLLKKDKEDTNKVKHLYLLSLKYTENNELDKGLSFGENSLKLANTIDFKKGIAEASYKIGFAYYNKNNFQGALKYYTAAINLKDYVKDNRTIVVYYTNIAVVQRLMGNYVEALKNNFTALKINEKIQDKNGISDSYNNIGTVYFSQGNYNEAIKNYSATLKIKKEINDKYGAAASFNNIGAALYSEDKFTSAEQNYLEALKIYKELKDENGYIVSYNNLGCVFFSQGDYTKALENYTIALKISKELKKDESIITSYANISDVYTKQHKIKEAEDYINMALKLAISSRLIETITNAYESLTILDSTKGDFKAAYDHYKLFISYRDSLNNIQAQRKSIEMTMQYDFDKKETATKFETDKIVSNLENQNKLQEQKQLFLIICIAIFIALMLVVLFFAKRAYDNKKKYSEVLSKENEHKELLLQEVHHRVNNSLQMISSLLSIQADTTTNEEIREYLLKSENRIQAMSTMHHLLHMGNSKLEVNIQQYLGEIINFYSKVLETKPNIKLLVEIPSANFHTKTALPLALLLNELLTNSIKYAFPKDEGNILISLTRILDSNQWILKITDNGIGFKEGDIGDKGTSLGLSLVKLMSRQISGKLNVNHDSGTSFELIFSEVTT